MKGNVRELRYVVTVSKDLNNENMKEIYNLLVDESDGTLTVNQLSDKSSMSKRTIRRKVSDSKVLKRVQSTNLSMVMFVNDVSERATNIALSCDKNNQGCCLIE